MTGSLTLDPRRPNRARVEVLVPVSKVVTASAGLTEHLLRPDKNGGKPDFFGPNPGQARFMSTERGDQGAKGAHSRPIDAQRRHSAGGASTRPSTAPARVPATMGGKENIGFTATGTIMRSQFGLTTGIPIIGDPVKLEISAAFEKAGG